MVRRGSWVRFPPPAPKFHAALTVGGVAANGQLCPGDSDFYKVTVVSGQTIAVTVTPSAEPDIVLTPYDPSQTAQPQVDVNGDGQPETALLSGTTGTWYVQVSAYFPDTAGTYTIDAQLS